MDQLSLAHLQRKTFYLRHFTVIYIPTIYKLPSTYAAKRSNTASTFVYVFTLKIQSTGNVVKIILYNPA